MLLMIDNYDSFTYNLVQYLGELGADVKVVRNDQASVAELLDLKPERLVVSPGPCTPDEAGISMSVIEAFAGKVPILGVCLGHQCVAQVYGGEVVRAGAIMHGKVSDVHHNGVGVLDGLPRPFQATRYHSLALSRSHVPDSLEVTAWTLDEAGEREEIMALQHRELPVFGVQFHPESILTPQGKDLLANFLRLH